MSDHWRLAESAERIEADAFAAVTLAAPADVARQLGLALVADGGAVATFAAAADVLALNRVVGLGLSTPATEPLLDRILAAARALGVRRLFVQLVPEAQPTELVHWLAARGGRPFNRWMRVWRRTDEPIASDRMSALDVVRVDAERAEGFARVVQSAFGMPPIVVPWLAAVVGRPGWEHWAVLDGDEPVAVGALYASGDVAWLGFAATLATHRGRGAQSALIAQRVRRARELGCTWAVAETAEDSADHPAPSYRNMRRLGFVDGYARENLLLVPGASPDGQRAAR